MKQPSYVGRDYTFGQTMLTLRTAIGFTQGKLAEWLGVSRRAVGAWEAGESYPKAKHLKALIELGLAHHAFSAEHEADEIREFWKIARQKVLLDEQWLYALLDRQLPPHTPSPLLPIEQCSASQQVTTQPPGRPQVDWGNALAVPVLYGRSQELALLTSMVVQERCRVVSVLGMGGIGKSALVLNVIHHLAEHFEVVIFRSLRDAPSCEDLLDDCLQVLSPHLLSAPQTPLQERIGTMLQQLRQKRVLVVLDNLETLLKQGDVMGQFDLHLKGYEMLLRRVAETLHQSCLLLTSREKPGILRSFEGKTSPVRSLRLSGLEVPACEQLLAEKQIVGTPQEQKRLIDMYAGNPLALMIVTETVADLFGGEISQFFAIGTTIFGNITHLLAEHFRRLSTLEQTVLCWLAIAREPITLDKLMELLVLAVPRVQILEAVDSLRRRSLIEPGQGPASFTLQSVVLEYMTATLVAQATEEIKQQRLDRLLHLGFIQASMKEHVRQAQQRLLIAPLLENLQGMGRGGAGIEERLLALLEQLRSRTDDAQGYGPANLMALLQQYRGHLRGINFSRLTIRGTNLRGIEMQDASLAGAVLHDTAFTEAFRSAWSVAISNSGTFWAAGSSRGEVRIWCEEGRTLHLAWQAHADNVYSLAFSPDERTLATGSWDGTFKLWDLQDGSLLGTGQHTNIVRSVAFSPDGHFLASGGDDAVVRLWEVASGRIVETLPHPGPVYATVWSPDGQLLASGNSDGYVRVWQMQEHHPATCIQTLMGHTNWVRGLAFAPDGRRLASSSWDQTIKLWDVHDGCLLQTLTGHTDRVRVVAWSPDGRTLASAGFDAMIRLWDIELGGYRVLHGHTAVVYSMAFTPDSRHLLSGSEDGTLRVWDSGSGQCVRIVQGHAVSLYDVDWNPAGTQLATAGTDMCIIIWDIAGKTPPRVLQGHRWVVQGIAWSPDGRWLASGGWDNAIGLWDATTGARIQILRDQDHTDTMFQNIAWSPNGRLLASGSYLYGVQVWDAATHTRLWAGRTLPTIVRRVAWNPGSTRLASCGDDGNVYLWEASNGRQLQTLQEHRGMVASIAWNPDGTCLASGGSGSEVFIWDVCKGERLQTLVGHSGIVFAIDWSKCGNLLVSGDSDGTICWWNVRRGICSMSRQGHQGAVQALKISPDGRTLASVGDDNTVKVWDVETAELLQTLRRDRPYERLDITGIRGLTEAQKVTLCMLGAIDKKPDHAPSDANLP